MRAISGLVLSAIFAVAHISPTAAYGAPQIYNFSDSPVMTNPADSPVDVGSPSAILIERTTGKTLYAKDEHRRMYPASMTKMLTALLAVEHLDLSGVVTVGDEIYNLPFDAMKSGHAAGETITVTSLLRLLMIRSGNETACVLAMEVARKTLHRDYVTYAEAESHFCGMMNDRARALGAYDSNFTNPHGYHSDDHYTTAHDLALIARAYMENDFLRQIASEPEFVSDSLDGQVYLGANVLKYNWPGHNQLIIKDSPNFYPYADGIKTGYTTPAGDCVTASATKGGVSLIAVVFDSADPGRWQDARRMFEFGFDNYGFETLQEQGALVDEVTVENTPLGEPDTLAVLADEAVVAFLSSDERISLTRLLDYGESPLKAPIEKDAVIGTVRYVLDGETLFEGPLRAADTVAERSLENDVDYYLASFKDNFFSKKSLPYWIAVGGVTFGLAGFGFAIKSRRVRNDWRNTYRGYR